MLSPYVNHIIVSIPDQNTAFTNELYGDVTCMPQYLLTESKCAVKMFLVNLQAATIIRVI